MLTYMALDWDHQSYRAAKLKALGCATFFVATIDEVFAQKPTACDDVDWVRTAYQCVRQHVEIAGGAHRRMRSADGLDRELEPGAAGGMDLGDVARQTHHVLLDHAESRQRVAKQEIVLHCPKRRRAPVDAGRDDLELVGGRQG